MIDELINFVAALNTAAADRVYDGAAPQDAAHPYVCVSKVSGLSGLVLEGADGFGRDRIQFDIVGDTRAQKAVVRTIARALRASAPAGLHGFHGTLGSVQVHCIEIANEIDLDEVDGDEFRPRVTQDYIVTYPEA